MRQVLAIAAVGTWLSAVTLPAADAALVHTSDFIADGSRTNFMGFEGLPKVWDAPPLHTEGGLRIEQINGDGNDIMTYFFASEGNRGWYPNCGDHGYTKITLLDGSDFDSIGMDRHSGSNNHDLLFYELYDDGSLVQSGSVAHYPYLPGYIGFSGGGFDTVLLRDGNSRITTTLGDGTLNALAIDAIEVTSSFVPEPTTLAIWGVLAGLTGLIGARRRLKIMQLVRVPNDQSQARVRIT